MESKFKYTQIKQTGMIKVKYPETKTDILLKQAGELIAEITTLNLFVRKKAQEAWVINYNLKQIGKNDTN